MRLDDSRNQLVAHNGKLYVRGRNKRTETVLEYTPGDDLWVELPPPPVKWFTIATLMGQLLVVGGVEKSTQKKTNKILGFLSKQWVSIQYPAMPTVLTYPAVIGYLDHLIIAGGNNSERNAPYVNILSTTSSKWKTAQPLPSTSEYYTVLIDDSMYLSLVGRDTQTVIRAHVPTLISGAKSGACAGDTFKDSILLLESRHHWQHPSDRGG